MERFRNLHAFSLSTQWILREPIKVKRDRASLGKAFFLLKSIVTQKQLYTLLTRHLINTSKQMTIHLRSLPIPN